MDRQTDPSTAARVQPGAHFPNVFLLAIQIRWKVRLAVIQLMAIRSPQIFAHATTAVQNFVAITLLLSEWEQNEISIGSELQWKNIRETGPWAFILTKWTNVLSYKIPWSRQCSKLLPVRMPEADHFGGGPGTFLKIFFNFMFMIWDSRQEHWQLFWLSFEHCCRVACQISKQYESFKSNLAILRLVVVACGPWWPGVHFNIG